MNKILVERIEIEIVLIKLILIDFNIVPEKLKRGGA